MNATLRLQGLLTLLFVLSCSSGSNGGTGGGSNAGGSGTGGAATGGSSTGGSGTGGSSAGGSGGSGGSNSVDNLVIPFDEETDSQDLAIDASGGVHVVAAIHGRNTENIAYAYCASNCGTKASWKTVVLGSSGVGNHEVSLELTTSGKPRVLQPGTHPSGTNGFDYLSCDSNCTTAGSWSRVRALDDNSRSDFAYQHEHFAVGPSGQAAFIYSASSGSLIALCAQNCDSASNWASMGLSSSAFGDVQLRYDSAGTLHLAYVDLSTPGSYKPFYMGCSSNCIQPTNWAGVQFKTTSNAPNLSLALSGNLPRLVAWYDDVGDTNINHKMLLLVCDSACTSPANWSSIALDWPEKTSSHVERRVKMFTDSQGATTLVSRALGALVVGRCTSNCTQPAGLWLMAPVNTSERMNATFPHVQPCQSATWFFEYGMSAGAVSSGTTVLAYGAHARALSGDDAGVCTIGFNFNYQTVLQVIP